MANKPPAEPMVQIGIRVPVSLLVRVKTHCVERERSMMEFVADALREKLRRGGMRRV